MQLKDIEEVLDLVKKGTELANPLANAWWIATEIDPKDVHGFLGFVSNPGAGTSITTGVLLNTPAAQATITAAMADVQTALAAVAQNQVQNIEKSLNDIYGALKSLLP